MYQCPNCPFFCGCARQLTRHYDSYKNCHEKALEIDAAAAAENYSSDEDSAVEGDLLVMETDDDGSEISAPLESSQSRNTAHEEQDMSYELEVEDGELFLSDVDEQDEAVAHVANLVVEEDDAVEAWVFRDEEEGEDLVDGPQAALPEDDEVVEEIILPEAEEEDVVLEPPADTMDFSDCDQNLYETHAAYVKKARLNNLGEHPSPVGKTSKVAIRLLKLLKDANAPLYMFDELMSWAKEGASEGAFLPQRSHQIPTRNRALKEAFARHNLTGFKPKEVDVLLPNAKIKVGVSTFDVEEVIRSLLTDPELMKDENLLFPNRDDPFEAPPKWGDIDPLTHVIDDISTGKRYIDSYHYCCKIGGRDILCPILTFQDKTFTDNKGVLCQEPVLITLGIFNRETRNRTDAWRPIGFVPNMDLLELSKNTTEKMSDYHVIVEYIMSKFYDMQGKKGFRWQFTYRGKKYDAVFRIPIYGLLGDNEGQDKACGRFGSRTAGVACLCRKCTTPNNMTGDVSGKTYGRINATVVRRYTITRNVTMLQQISHHCLTNGNAFDRADFGSGSGKTGGCNQATPR